MVAHEGSICTGSRALPGWLHLLLLRTQHQRGCQVRRRQQHMPKKAHTPKHSQTRPPRLAAASMVTKLNARNQSQRLFSTCTQCAEALIYVHYDQRVNITDYAGFCWCTHCTIGCSMQEDMLHVCRHKPEILHTAHAS